MLDYGEGKAEDYDVEEDAEARVGDVPGIKVKSVSCSFGIPGCVDGVGG